MLAAIRRFAQRWFRRPPPMPEIVLTADGVALRRPDALIGELAWSAVERVVTFKRDLMTTDEVLVVFEYRDVTGAPMTFTVSEECPGFPDFMAALRRAFPTIPPDWYRRVMTPAFAPNFAQLYPPVEADAVPDTGAAV